MKARKGRKAKLISFLCVALALFFSLFSACDCQGYSVGEYEEFFETSDGFSVNYLSVGNGDAIFINFGDGKTMLIDCAEKNERNFNTVTRYIDYYAKNGLDYLLLTHPDGDHVGNAVDIIDKYQVKTAFIPDLLTPEVFGAYYKTYQKLKEKETAGETVLDYSTVYDCVLGEDYYLIMLSPNDKSTTDSAYTAVNSSENPSADDINNLSPIIYLDYKGVRFVFTGDAGFSQETVAINNAKFGLVDKVLEKANKPPVNLDGVDFLKVSHHGAADASGKEFLDLLAPKNAVISVGGDNSYGHPTESTLKRIYNANNDCDFYLTSIVGTVSVFVDGNGQVSVKTPKKSA